MSEPVSLLWFRRDLRVADHPALHAAARRGPCACLFVIDPDLLARRHHRCTARLAFLRAGLEALDRELRARGVSLGVRVGVPRQIVPEVAAQIGADEVHASRELSPYAVRRDAEVGAALAAAGRRLVLGPTDLVAEPEALLTAAGTAFRVFTPFYRAWSASPLPAHLPAPEALRGPAIDSDGLSGLPGDQAAWPAGPDAARAVIVRAVRSGVADGYAEARDLLAADATTHLSPYLRFGMCTSAQVGRALGIDRGVTTGPAELWRQICWREYFQYLMHHSPEALRMSMRRDLRGIAWTRGDAELRSWQAGETGYPLVDAAMRALAADGWLHNRGRLVVASFLAKHLLVDWRRGESHFMQSLLDGDPGSNNGGWQWVAGTGVDAAPYFRVFSPVRQGERFDPDGAYVRRWLPELADVPDRFVHAPWTMGDGDQRTSRCRIGVDYPAPMVDHAQARARAIAAFRAALEGR